MKQILGVLFVVLILVSAWLLGRWLQPHSEQKYMIASVTPCNPVKQTCEISLADNLVKFHIATQPSALKPFKLELIPKTEIEQVYAEFSMKSMEMGGNRVAFVQSGQGWEAEAILPVCVSGGHDWIVKVMIDFQGQMWQAQYEFSVE